MWAKARYVEESEIEKEEKRERVIESKNNAKSYLLTMRLFSHIRAAKWVEYLRSISNNVFAVDEWLAVKNPEHINERGRIET